MYNYVWIVSLKLAWVSSRVCWFSARGVVSFLNTRIYVERMTIFLLFFISILHGEQLNNADCRDARDE